MSKKTKQYFNVTLAAAVAASGVAVVAPAATEASTTFKDVKATDNFYNYIVELQDRGIIKGYKDGTFRPNQSVTRGQAAKILAGVLALDTKNVKDPGFKDIPKTHEYYGAIAALENAGIIKGYGDNTFRQDQPVLRNHMAKMIANGFSLTANGAENPFTDARGEYVPFITALFANDVTTGKTATTFGGTANVTRGQLAAFVVRAENVKKPAAEVEAKEVAFTIEEVTAAGVKTAEHTYTAGAQVKALFAAANAAALKEAKIVALVENNEIVSVKAVTVVAEGTLNAGNATITGDVTIKAANVTVKNTTVQGKLIVDELAAKPVASLTAIAANTASNVVLENVTAATVEVKRDNVALSSDKKLANVVLATNVKTVAIDAAVAKLAVNGTVTINGNAVIDEVTVADNVKITLHTAVKVAKIILPKGAKIEDVVTNYAEVKANIATIEVAKTDVTPSYAGGGGGSSRDDDDDDDSSYTIGAVNGDKIASAGMYGPETGTQVVEGNLIITSADVTLRNVTVKGNLILGEGIGEGDVRLKGVKVEGETRVNGGGKNSIYFEDSILAMVIVNKNSGAVRIVAQGSTQVFEVQLETPTLVVEQNLDADSTGFEDIVVSEAMQTAGEGIQVELQGIFDTVNSRATNVRINLSEATDIRTLILNVAAQILGAGTIQTARINAEGSTISQRPQNVVLDISGHVTIAGEIVTESYSDPNATAVVSAIRAAQSSISVEMDNFVAGLHASDFDVVAKLDGQEITLNGLYFDANKQRFTFEPIALTGNIGKTVEVTVTPKHEKLSAAAVASSYTVATGFSGRITDIQGVGIPNLAINFYAGETGISGSVVKTVKTDAYGYYTVDVPAGAYVGEFSAPGYLTTHMFASAPSDVFNVEQNETAMRAAASEEVKIMLTWDQHPRDLDSHLIGPAMGGNEFHIAYYEKQYTDNGVVYADLDWDDVDSYGPETTTIRKLVDGEYRFYVHHFSGFNTLRTSGAKVHVYLGNATTPTQSFEVPAGSGTEIIWNVFDLIVTNNGETVTIRPVNTLEEERPAEMLTDVTAAKYTILDSYMELDVLETADQATKTAAVQAFINGLALPQGVTATVEYKEYNGYFEYVVTLEKNDDTLTFTVYPSFAHDPNAQQPELTPTPETLEEVDFTFDAQVATADIASIDVTEVYTTTTADSAVVTSADGASVAFDATGAFKMSFGTLAVTTNDTVIIVIKGKDGSETPYEVAFDGTKWVATVRTTNE